MGWSEASSASELRDARLGKPPAPPAEGFAAASSASVRCRSRSPRVHRKGAPFGIESRRPNLPVVKGTEWWAPVIETSMAHLRDELPEESRPRRIESACSGTLAEVWICQAYSQRHAIGDPMLDFACASAYARHECTRSCTCVCDNA